MRASPREESLQVVVVTVCLEPDLCHDVMDAVDSMPWLVDLSHLNSFSSATRRPAFGPQMKAAGRGIAFIDFSQNVTEAIDCTRYLVETFGSRIAVVAVGDDQRPDIILDAVRAGCREYLPSTAVAAPLCETLHRFHASWSERSLAVAGEGSVLALLGAKGGVGTTALAVHLAVSLCIQHRKRVLLVDTQPELGHACIYLGLDGTQFTFAEVVRNVNRLDSDLLQGFVARHASGLAVLSSPDTSQHQRPLEPNAITKTIEFLRSEYDYVVVDCDRSFSGATQVLLDAASRVYVIATPEMCTLRDVSRHLDRLLKDEQTAERLQVVLNRSSSRSGLDPEQVERSLRLPVHVRVPNDYQAMVRAGNLGQPIEAQSKSEIAKAITRWSNSLIQLKQPAMHTPLPQSASLLSRLGGTRWARKGAMA